MNRHRPLPQPLPLPRPPARFIDPQLVARAAALKETIWLRIGTLQTDMGDHDRSLDAFERVLRLNSANLHALTQVGAVLAKKSRFVMAIGHLQRAVSINATCGEAWAVLGHCYLMKDDLPKAYEAFQNALNHLRNPSDPNLWYSIGLLYDRYGSLDNALEAFHAVLRIAPHFERNIEVCFCVGVIYKEQRKLDQALAYFDRVRTSPHPPIPPLTRADTWYQLGHVNELKKDIPKALEMYKLALGENPGHSKTLQNLGWLEHTKLDNSRQAIGRLQMSLDADENDAQTWYLLGRVHMRLEEFKQAYDAYQQAVYRDGRNSTYWCSIGVLYSHMNQFRDAMDAYARAIRLNPQVSEVWFDLGTLYERTGQADDAITAYMRAAELASDKDRTHIRERLHLLQSNRGGPSNNIGNQARRSSASISNISNMQRPQHPHPHPQLPSMRTQNPHTSLPRNTMQMPSSSAQRAQPPTGINAPTYSKHLRSSMPLLSSLPLPASSQATRGDMHPMQPAHNHHLQHQRTSMGMGIGLVRKDPREMQSARHNMLSQALPLPKLPPKKPINVNVAADGKQRNQANPISMTMSLPIPHREHSDGKQHNNNKAPRLPLPHFRIQGLAPLGQNNASKRSIGMAGPSSMMNNDSDPKTRGKNGLLHDDKKNPALATRNLQAAEDAARKEEESNGLKDANLLLATSSKKSGPGVSAAPTVSESSGSVNVNIPIPALPLPSLRSAPAPQPKHNKTNGNGIVIGSTSLMTPRFGLSLSNLARSNAPKIPATLPLPFVHAPPAPLKVPSPPRNDQNSSSPEAPRNGTGINIHSSAPSPPLPSSDRHIPAVPKVPSPTVEKTSSGVVINIPRSVPISSLTGGDKASPTRNGKGNRKLTPSKRGACDDESVKITTSKRPRICQNDDGNKTEGNANSKSEEGKENVCVDANANGNGSNGNGKKEEAVAKSGKADERMGMGIEIGKSVTETDIATGDAGR